MSKAEERQITITYLNHICGTTAKAEQFQRIIIRFPI